MDVGNLILFEAESLDRRAKPEDTSLRITSTPESRSPTQGSREWSESRLFDKPSQDDEPHGVLEDDPIRWDVSRWEDLFQRKPFTSRHILPGNSSDPPTSRTPITRPDPLPNRPPDISTSLEGSKASPLIPRQYQLHIYERALNENTIVTMDTGSGKTLVAALLIKEMRRREVEANRGLAKVRCEKEGGIKAILSFFTYCRLYTIDHTNDILLFRFYRGSSRSLWCPMFRW